MDVALLCPLAVGVVRWPTGAAAIVKATFMLGGSRPGSLSRAQEPLWGDAAADGSSDEELECASDFVPKKARADVLLVGRARGKRGSVLAVELAVGGLHKRATAIAGAPCSSLPLSARFLRSDAGTPTRFGPRARPARWRSQRDAYDDDAFNVAPDDQQLPSLPSGVRIALTGVGPQVAPEVQLPPIEPAAFFVPSRAPHATGTQVPLVCDTLWIHAERGICTLTWRGPLPGAYLPREAFLVVDIGLGPNATWAAVAPRLVLARWTEAAEDVDVVEDEVTQSERDVPVSYDDRATRSIEAPEASTRPRMLRTRASTVRIGLSDLDDAPSTMRAASDPAPDANDQGARATPMLQEETQALAVADGYLAGLPPHVAAKIASLDTQGNRTVQLEGQPRSGPALPFVPSPSAKAGMESFFAMQPTEVAHTAQPKGPRRGSQTLNLDAASALLSGLGGALPFPNRAPASGPPPEAPPSEARRPEALPPEALPPEALLPEAVPQPAPPRAIVPDVVARVSADLLDSSVPAPVAAAEEPLPFCRLDLDVYAKIKVGLLEDDSSLAALLLAHDIDERTWRANERSLAEQLAQDAAKNKGALSTKLSQAMARANQGKAATVLEDGELEAYATARAEIEEADDPEVALRQLGLTENGWAGIRRDWSRRCLADPALADELRQRLAAARHALRRQENEL